MNTNKSRFTINKAQRYGFMLFILGTLIYTLTFLEAIFSLPIWLNSFIKDFTQQLGIGLIVGGIISIILGLKDWQNQFLNQLKSIVLSQDYLKNLSETELNNIQLGALKAKYKGGEIDREGSFIHYLQQRIQHYVGSAYREGIVQFMDIKEHDKDNFRIKDRLVYVCRKVGDNYIETVGWQWEPHEINTVTDAKLVIKCNKDDKICNKCSKRDDCSPNGEIILDFNILEQKYRKDDNKICGYLIKLQDLIELHDGVRIELTTTHIKLKSSLIIWTMTHPSKDIDLTITYPKEYQTKEFIGGIEDNEYIKNSEEGILYYSIKGWILPRSGVSITINK